MATQHTVRLLALVPANRKNAVNTWIRNNLDATGADWLGGLGYSASGNAPATHYVFNAALTIPQFRAITAQLLQMSSIALPADWDAKTKAQKFTWLRGQYAAVRTATGIRLRVFDNDGVWENPQDELTAAGLKPITPKLEAQSVQPQSLTVRATERAKQIDWRYVAKGTAIGSALALGAAGAAAVGQMLGLW